MPSTGGQAAALSEDEPKTLRGGHEESRSGCGLCRQRQPGVVQDERDTDIVRKER